MSTDSALSQIDALIAAFADAVIVVDAGRRVVAANAAAGEIAPVPTTGRDLALGLRHPDVLAAVDAVLGGAAKRDLEVVLQTPMARTFRVRVAGLGGLEGAAAMVMLRDATEARGAERMRADFVANVSHELRSPLASLVGFIETLRGPARDDAQARARFLAIMDTEAKRMARLIDDLLSLSRVEADEHLRPRGGVAIAALLTEIADSLGHRAAEKGMTIELRLAPDLPDAVGERDELSLVFRNLIDNAIAYGRENTAIDVTAIPVARIPDSGEAGIAVTVADRGEGIASDHIPRLTERFYRVDKGRSREMGGTGLGLAIVKHIVGRHRGHLTIESSIGEGSRFTVHLPTTGVDD